MALADPQVLPADPVINLDRISTEMGRFGSSDATYELQLDHSRKARSRHLVRLTHRKISADPLLPSQNREYAVNVNLTIDHPNQGFSAAELTVLGELFVEYLSTAGLMADVIQGQA